jgi:deferrochelatase/peroxidase EfeB
VREIVCSFASSCAFFHCCCGRTRAGHEEFERDDKRRARASTLVGAALATPAKRRRRRLASGVGSGRERVRVRVRVRIKHSTQRHSELAHSMKLTQLPLTSFETIIDANNQPMFVAAKNDVVLLVKSNRADLCYSVSKRFLAATSGDCVVTSRTMAFRYEGGRDLTGFIDGTRNFDVDLGGPMLVRSLARARRRRQKENNPSLPVSLSRSLLCNRRR